MISIVIPTYNRAHKLVRTLDSFINQSFNNWECIVVDDFSTDNTKDLVLEYQKKDDRFRYIINNRSKGAQGARNTGILLAKGEWIALFDSDDIAYTNFLEVLTNHINDTASVITSRAISVDSLSGDPIEEIDWTASGNITKSLLSGLCYVGYNGTLIKRNALFSIGLLDEHVPSHQEFDTHLRLSLKYTYTSTDTVLSEYHIGGNDTISVDSEKHIAGWTYLLQKHKWLWRRSAYTSFVVRARKLWDSCCSLSNYKKYRFRLLLCCPEVLLILLRRRLCQIFK